LISQADKKSPRSFWGLKTLSSMENPVYRIYFFGTLAMFAALTMQMVTGPLLMYRLTGSKALLGTVSLAFAVPLILLSLFGGTIADRIQKKTLLWIGLFLLSGIALGLSLGLLYGYISPDINGSWRVLFASSFCQGTVMGMIMPAVQAIIPEIVSRDKAMNAVALNNLGMNVMNLVAPAVAGFLIDASGFTAVYFTIFGLFICGGITCLFLKHRSKFSGAPGSIMDGISEGVKYVRNDLTMMFILLFTLLVVMLSMPYQQMLPVFVDDILKVGATGMGILMSVSGAGALVGSLVIASLPDKKRGILLLLAGLISGISLLVFSFSAKWALSLGAIVFVGLGQTMRNTLGSALVQSYTKPVYMGRMMSILSMQWGVMSVCTFAAGLLAERIPVQWVLGGFSIILIICSILGTAFVPRLRKLD